MRRRLWRIISDFETIRGLLVFAGFSSASIVASHKISMMVGGFLENPFEPMAWFFGTLFLISLALVSVRFVWSMVPANKFHGLSNDARELYDRFNRDVRYDEERERHYIAEPDTRRRVFTLKQRLDDLRIPTPSLNYFDFGEWYFWLPRLASWAETKNLYEARNHKL